MLSIGKNGENIRRGGIVGRGAWSGIVTKPDQVIRAEPANVNKSCVFSGSGTPEMTAFPRLLLTRTLIATALFDRTLTPEPGRSVRREFRVSRQWRKNGDQWRAEGVNPPSFATHDHDASNPSILCDARRARKPIPETLESFTAPLAVANCPMFLHLRPEVRPHTAASDYFFLAAPCSDSPCLDLSDRTQTHLGCAGSA